MKHKKRNISTPGIMLHRNRHHHKSSKIFGKVFSGIILCLISASALYGGWALMAEPSGALLNMSVNTLSSSPFTDYTIPGITLFIVIGCGSLVVLLTMVLSKKSSKNLLIYSGLTLSGWIVIQMIMIQHINMLHVAYLLAGLMLAIFGSRKAHI